MDLSDCENGPSVACPGRVEVVAEKDWHEGSVTTRQAASVRQFIRKLNYEEVCEAIDITAIRVHSSSAYQQWKYFCAVCWRKIKGEVPDVS